MKKTLRIVSLVLVIGVIIAAIATSMSIKPSNADKVWDTEMTVGDLDAKNYFIIYSDLMCPYCIAFENAIVENEEAFKQYIKDNDVLLEVRLSDFLYEYGESHAINSRYSAEAVYCAKNAGRFWDYYNLAITTLWDDYFRDSGKTAFSALNSKDKSYWIELGENIGLGEEFSNCVENDETLAEIEKSAEKTSRLASGMPYFKFNNYTTSGFDPTWGWEYVLMYFEAGLES